MQTFYFYNLCLPDDVTCFLIPGEAIRRWDAEVQVYDVLVGSDLVLRHYAFYQRWFEINCTLDLHGNFVAEAGPIPWCFNIDICTPFFSKGNRGFNVDLCLDVLVAPDGDQYVIKDEGDFAHATRQHWITDKEHEGARAGLANILQIVTSGALLPLLREIYPFDVRGAALQLPPEKPDLAAVGELNINDRWRHFGRYLNENG
jgi:predicted RNA-binding protein associated with RNAse of E/G family